VQDSVRLGKEVVSAIGGVALGNGHHDGLGGVSEDRNAEVVRAQERQVVAVSQRRDEGELIVHGDVFACAIPPLPGQGGETVLGLVRPRGDRGHLVQSHVLDAGGSPSMGRVLPELRSVPRNLLGALRELGHERLGDAGDLVAGFRRVSAPASLPADAETCGQKVREDTLVQLGTGCAERRRRHVARPPSGHADTGTEDPVPISEPVMATWARLVVDCRNAGIQRTVKLTDALIAATAIDLGLPVVTQDDDYDQMARAHPAVQVP
jgi:predicted nucleic acid-binding protein